MLSLPDVKIVSQYCVTYTIPLSLLDEQKETRKINWYAFSNGAHGGAGGVLVATVVLPLLPVCLLLLSADIRRLENCSVWKNNLYLVSEKNHTFDVRKIPHRTIKVI